MYVDSYGSLDCRLNLLDFAYAWQQRAIKRLSTMAGGAGGG